MRLLVTTQAVDLGDPALAFFHQWLVALAGRFEAVEVICLYEGRHTLPANVQVYSLGKPSSAPDSAQATMGTKVTEGTGSRLLLRVRYVSRLYRLLWQLGGRYDAVFVHMNPEYLVLAGWWWRLRGRRAVLWYTHRSVDAKLRVAVFFASAVATAAPESLRLASKKARVLGHGIDTAAFATARDGTLHEPLALLAVGRVTPIKRLEVMLDALALLDARGVRAMLTIVGAPTVPADSVYEGELAARAKGLGSGEAVRFAGARAYEEMPSVYRAHDIALNAAPTGGVDKAVLEAMAAGCITLAANEAFRPVFGADADALLCNGTAEGFADKLAALSALSVPERAALAARLAESARRAADIGPFVERLAALIEGS